MRSIRDLVIIAWASGWSSGQIRRSTTASRATIASKVAALESGIASRRRSRLSNSVVKMPSMSRSSLDHGKACCSVGVRLHHECSRISQPSSFAQRVWRRSIWASTASQFLHRRVATSEAASAAGSRAAEAAAGLAAPNATADVPAMSARLESAGRRASSMPVFQREPMTNAFQSTMIIL